MIVAIDGSAGTGKSSTAKRVAHRLGFTYFDTGALFRAITLLVIENGLDHTNELAVRRVMEKLNFRIEREGEKAHYYDGDRDISAEIRSHEVTKHVSLISAYGFVRKHTLKIQREFGQNGSVVLEGRDIGTVVFPKAQCKFFLSANLQTRAKRRYAEIRAKYPEDLRTVEGIEKEMVHRDEKDSTRKIAPLKKAKDAFEIDTSDLTLIEVVSQIESRVRAVINPPPKKLSHFSLIKGFICFVQVIYFYLFYRYTVIGKEKILPGKALVASNHASHLDPSLLQVAGRWTNYAFIGRDTLQNNRFFKWLINQLDFIPVRRGEASTELLKKVKAITDQGGKIALFPEGSRSSDGEIQKPKEGIGLMARITKAPVIPAYIYGSHYAFGKGRKFPRMLADTGVIFGNPIYYSSYEHLPKKEIAAAITNEWFRRVKELEKKYKKSQS